MHAPAKFQPTNAAGAFDPRGLPLPLHLASDDPGLLMAVLRGGGVSGAELDQFKDHRDEAVLTALARHPQLTSKLAGHIAAAAEIGAVVALALRPDLPADVAKDMSGDRDERIRAAAAMCQNLTADAAKILAMDSDRTVRCVLAMMGFIPAELLPTLAADPDPEVRKALGTNLQLASATREQFALGADPLLRRLAAGRLDLPLHLVARLSADPAAAVRAAVAARPHLAPELAKRLGGDPEESVRAAVGEGRAKALPPGTKLPLPSDQAMAFDNYPLRRAWAAVNFILPREISRRLATDEASLVRTALAFNPHADPRSLSRLAGDANEGVRLAALAHPSLPEEAMLTATTELGCDDEACAQVLLGHARLPAAVLGRLSRHPAKKVRRLVALRLEIPRAVFDVLARDPSSWPRRVLAARWDFPTSWYRSLVGDQDVPVLEHLADADHPGRLQDGAQASLQRLIGSESSPATRRAIAALPEITRELVARLMRDVAPEVRAVIAANPETGGAQVLRLARDPTPVVRLAVAQRTRLSPKVVEVLGEDSDPGVRAAAAARGGER